MPIGGDPRNRIEQVVRAALAQHEALGRIAEDSRVEYKGSWPQPRKVARQLAGRANAAGGHPVYLIVGIDEKSGLVSFVPQDSAQWTQKLRSEFDGPMPAAQFANVDLGEDRFVYGIEFGTESTPYVVILDNEQRDVPWHEGETRSARRDEVIRLCRPGTQAIELSVVGAFVDFHLSSDLESAKANIMVRLLANPGDRKLFLDFRRQRLVLAGSAEPLRIDHCDLSLDPSQQFAGIRELGSGLIVTEPGVFYLTGQAADSSLHPDDYGDTLDLDVFLDSDALPTIRTLRVTLDRVPGYSHSVARFGFGSDE